MRKSCSPFVFSASSAGLRKTPCALTFLLLLLLLGSAGTLLGQDKDAIASAAHPDPVASATAESPIPPVAQPLAKSTVTAKIPKKYDVDEIGDRGVGKGINFFSLSRERAMGENMSRDLDAHLQLVRDPELNAYVNRVVQNLVMHSDATIPFTVRIVKNDEVNAFSLPGGFLYINTGLIAAAPDEATFAGILAHEVAHVAARHATRTLTRQMMFRIATIPLLFLTGGVGAAAGNGASFAIPLSNMKFSRDSEREADLLGLEYAYAAGYDPAAFVQFFETLQSRQKHKMPRFFGLMFTSHPMNDDRIKRAQEVISTMLPGRTDYVIDTSEFEQAKTRLFQMEPCHDINGRPVLLGAGQRCGGKTDPKARPTLRGKLHPRPNVTP